MQAEKPGLVLSLARLAAVGEEGKDDIDCSGWGEDVLGDCDGCLGSRVWGV